MAGTIEHRGGPARRDLLRGALLGSGLAMVGGSAAPIVFSRPAEAAKPANERILVVVELSGANDGLNTVVPFGDDAYYRARPKLGLPAKSLRKIDDHFGFPVRMAGFERLYKDGHMAIVQGVGYDHPSFSHFSSMAYWHTGAPNSGDAYGWLGRLADAVDPSDSGEFLVNIQSGQSLAVRAEHHVPLVFDDPHNSPAAASTTSRRCCARWRRVRSRATQPRNSCSPLRAARRPRNNVCTRPAPAIIHRSITDWPGSGWIASPH